MTSRTRELATSSSPLTVLDEERGQFLFAAWKNVSIFFWLAQATGMAVLRLARATDPLYAAHPEGVSNIHVVPGGTDLPTTEAQREMLALMKSRADRRACMAVVLGGTGFWASALRSFITSVRFVSPRSHALTIHGTLQQAAFWLPRPHFERSGVWLERAELLAALQSVEEQSLALRATVSAHKLVTRR
ncbi:MAG TPA: hypothetical protein VG963_21930 [Polyangiaceae bacterium]|nr:hypothetical protein [Polyangiaceae bacterium]